MKTTDILNEISARRCGDLRADTRAMVVTRTSEHTCGIAVIAAMLAATEAALAALETAGAAAVAPGVQAAAQAAAAAAAAL